MSGIGVLLYEIEDGCQPVFYLVKDIPRARCIRIIHIAKQRDGFLDEFAVIHRQWHFRNGVVGIGVCVVYLVVYHNWGIVAKFV